MHRSDFRICGEAKCTLPGRLLILAKPRKISCGPGGPCMVLQFLSNHVCRKHIVVEKEILESTSRRRRRRRRHERVCEKDAHFLFLDNIRAHSIVTNRFCY